MGHALGGSVDPPFDGSALRNGEPEFLVLDIGGDVGALVLYADESYLGAEIDLTPAGTPRNHHVHTVIRRRAPAREVVAGVWLDPSRVQAAAFARAAGARRGGQC